MDFSKDFLSGLNMTPKIKLPEIKDLKILDPDEYKRSDYQYELIKKAIQSFESSLDDDHEVAVKLASFGQSLIMTVIEIGYSNPYLMLFYGLIDGQPATLIQHMNQLNFLLLSVPKSESKSPPRRIGFVDSSASD